MFSSRFVPSLFLISLLAFSCIHSISAVSLKRDRLERLVRQKIESMIQKGTIQKGNFLSDLFGSFGWGFDSNALNTNGNNFINGNGNPINGNGNILNSGGNALNNDGNIFNSLGNALNSGGNALNSGGNVLNSGGNALNNGGNALNNGGNALNNGGNALNNGGNVLNNGGNAINQNGNVLNGGQGNPLKSKKGPGGLVFEFLGGSNINNNQVLDTINNLPIDVTQLQRSDFPQYAFHFNNVVVPVGFNLCPSVHPQLSIELWVKLHTVINNRGWIIGHDNGGYDRSVILHDDRYGGVAFGTGNFYTSTLGKLDLNVWTHLVGTFQNGKTMTMYRNYNTQQKVSVNNDEGDSTMTLGGLANFQDHTADAWIGELRIYDFILTPAQVQTLYTARKSTYAK